MERGESFNLNFSKGGETFSFRLEKKGEESNAVFVNGKKFYIQGEGSQLEWIKSKIPEFKQQTDISLDNLHGHLQKLEVEDLHMPKIDKMNFIGIDSLHIKDVKTSSKNGENWFKGECKQKRAIAEKYWDLKVLQNQDNIITHQFEVNPNFLEDSSFQDTSTGLEKVFKPQFYEKLEKKENDHSGFIGFISNSSEFDPEGNVGHEIAQNLLKAIQTEDRTGFIKLFESLPMGIAAMVNHGEGLNAMPPPPTRNEQKKELTHEDIQGLRQYIKDSGFSGVVCLSDKKQSYTLSSENIKDSQIPFAMHSVGKVFTGLLAMKMIQEGFIQKDDLERPIKLDSSVLEMLPQNIQEHLTKEGAPSFQQIMLHQGGFGDYLDKYEFAIGNALENNQEPPVINGPEDFIKNKFLDENIIDLKEGEDHYSNIGILLVGLSLQHHYNKFHDSKMSYQEILHELILDPAKLSSFSEKKPENASFNESHTAASYYTGGPAGGYWISAQDLLRFGEWSAKQCEDPQFSDLVDRYGREFSTGRGEISHGGQINSATSFLGVFAPLEKEDDIKPTFDFSNSINISILSNRPLHAAVLEGVIRDKILSK